MNEWMNEWMAQIVSKSLRITFPPQGFLVALVCWTHCMGLWQKAKRNRHYDPSCLGFNSYFSWFTVYYIADCRWSPPKNENRLVKGCESYIPRQKALLQANVLLRLQAQFCLWNLYTYKIVDLSVYFTLFIHFGRLLIQDRSSKKRHFKMLS